MSSAVKFGAVAIGRNEGERLKRCLRSLTAAGVVVYVDSGSTDGSAQWAADSGTDVIELDMSAPFTAARARNAGFRRVCEIEPEISFVQFVDGDCEIVRGWMESAVTFLASRPDVDAVSGALHEPHPDIRCITGCASRNGVGRWARCAVSEGSQ